MVIIVLSLKQIVFGSKVSQKANIKRLIDIKSTIDIYLEGHPKFKSYIVFAKKSCLKVILLRQI